MKERLALRVLADVMSWPDERARAEYDWLRLMARMQYDGYEDFLAGVRFLENLITWLQQFAVRDREVAYALVRRRLIYVSTAQLVRLVERFYRLHVEPHLLAAAAAAHDIKPWAVWGNAEARTTVEKLRRQTLFIGLSDGARTDVLRRANSGIISNEQVVLAPLIDDDKWTDLGADLAGDPRFRDAGSPPKFTTVYLIDDLTASSTTLIRQQGGAWKGKLPRFYRSVERARTELGERFPLTSDFRMHVHHHIATQAALDTAARRCEEARAELPAKWFQRVDMTAGLMLSEDDRVKPATDPELDKLTADYYDASLQNRHTAASGVESVRLGYGGCGLTLVLEHNTPNNSLPLLWAETEGRDGAHALRPLFRRRTRHVE